MVMFLISSALVALPMAHALSCPDPPDKAVFEIADVYSRKVVERIPYDDPGHGPGCGPGNLHALRGDWFAWIGAPIGPRGDHEPGTSPPGAVHVRDLSASKEIAFLPVIHAGIRGLDLAETERGSWVLLLTMDEDTWTVDRHEVTSGARTATALEPLSFRADQAVLQGRLIVLLIGQDAVQPRIVIHDLVTSRTLRAGTVETSHDTAKPWRLLAGDHDWTLLASGAVHTDFGTYSGTHLWAHEAATAEVRSVWRAPIDEEAGEDPWPYGGIVLDDGRLYSTIWPNGAWSPRAIEARDLPDGPTEESSAKGLMRGLVVDQGRLVTGRYVSETDAAVPAPAAFLLAAALLAITWVGRSNVGSKR